MCDTRLQDSTSLLAFVIAPLLVYVVVGTTAVLAGFISLIGIRDKLDSDLAQDEASLRNLENLMAKMGEWEEQAFKQAWESSWDPRSSLEFKSRMHILIDPFFSFP